MAKGFGGMSPNFGGMNMNNLMKQAQKMQKQMEDAKAALGEKTLEVTMGGGAIKVVSTGDKVIKEIKILPDAVDVDDIESLEDMIMSAVNEALRQADELSSNEMSKFGLPSGGLF